MMIEEMDKIDRISELPEFILHIILSILDTKETIRASVLSKKWYRAWSSIPVLDFQPKYFKKVRDIDSNYYYSDDDDSCNDYIYDDRTVKRFIRFVDKTMQRYSTRKYRITKLDILLPDIDENIKAFVDKWISIAVQNQIQELNINVLLGCIQEYELPEILFRAKSLKVLTCNNVNLRYYDTMDLVSLCSLSFFLGKLDEDMLQQIISLSPLVKLCITHWNLGKISLPWSRKEFEKTSGLEEFEFHGLRNISSWAWNMNVSALKNLRKLRILACTITDEIVSEIAYGLVSLESLELSSCLMLKRVKISSSSLKEFRIEEDHEKNHLLKIIVDTPNLLEFWCSCDAEAYLSLNRAQNHCNTCFLPPWMKSVTVVSFVKLKKFLVETNCFKSLVIDLDNIEQIDIDKDILGNLVVCTGSPYKLRELKLRETNDRFFLLSSIKEFLDALFWTCKPELLSLCFQNIPPQDILGYLKRKVQCWKNPLKKVEVEGVDCSNLFKEPSGVEFRFRLSWFSIES